MAIQPIQILINAKDEASAVIGRLGKNIAALGASVAAYFGVKTFAGAVGSAADFEQAMSRVKAATGAGAQEMAALQNAAQDAGRNTKFTAVQAAQALENLAKAGLDSAAAIKTLPSILSLAAAADVELGTAAEFVTKAVMGMGLSFDDAGRVADVLAKGANASNTSVSGLAQALSYVAPIAKSAGVGLEGTVAIIGKLADGGIDASRAGTGLANIMAQFSDPSSKFREALLGAGITTKDFEQALHELAASGPRAEKAILAVGLEAGPALRSLLNQGMPALDEMKSKLESAAGSSAEAARIMGDNLSGSMTALGSAWDGVKTALATPVLPVLKSAVDQLAGAFKSAIDSGAITKFGEAIKEAFSAGVEWARNFVGALDMSAAIAKMQGWAQDFGAAMKTVSDYASVAGNTVSMVWGVMGAGVDTLKIGIYTIAAAFSGVASNLLNGVATISEGLAKITFGGVSERFKAAAGEARDAAAGMWGASEEFERRANQSIADLSVNVDRAGSGFAGLGSAIGRVGSASGELGGAVAQTKELADESKKAQEELQKVADALVTASNAALKKQAEDEASAQQLADMSQKVRELRAEYDALVSAQDFSGAVAKHQQLTQALRDLAQGTAASGQAAQKAAAEFDAGLTGMGVNADAALGRVSGAVTRSIGDLDSLAKAARESGMGTEQAARAMEMAFAAAVPKANSLEGIAALEAKLKDLQASGLLGAAGVERMSAALRAQGAEIAAQIPGINSVAEALKQLGVKPQAELDALARSAREAFTVVQNSGSTTAREINEAWRAMADAAIAANGGVADATLRAEASSRGYAVAVDAAGKSSVVALNNAADAARGVGAALDSVSGSAGNAASAIQGVQSAAQSAAQGASDAADSAAKSATAGAKAASRAAGSLLAPAWTDATAAASKYAYEATKAMWESVKYQGVQTQVFEAMSYKATQYVKTLERLDQQEKALQDSQSGNAKRIADQRVQLAEINGTEEEIAAARVEREKAGVRLEIERMGIELQRAQLRKDSKAIAQAEQELTLLREQVKIIEQIAQAERAKKAQAAADAQAQKEATQKEAARKNEQAQKERDTAAAAAAQEKKRQDDQQQRQQEQERKDQERSAQQERQRQEQQEQAAQKERERQQEQEQSAAQAAQQERQRQQAQRRQDRQAANAAAAGPVGATARQPVETAGQRSISINLQLGGQRMGVVQTDAASADVLQRFFSEIERAQRSAR